MKIIAVSKLRYLLLNFTIPPSGKLLNGLCGIFNRIRNMSIGSTWALIEYRAKVESIKVTNVNVTIDCYIVEQFCNALNV